LGIAVITGILAAGCARPLPVIYGARATPPSAAEQWTPPPEVVSIPAPLPAEPSIPKGILKPGRPLTLLDIVDIALRNNPETAATWEQARSAAAAYGSKEGGYYPQVGATAGMTRLHGQVQGGTASYNQRDYSMGVQLNWLLFDFGVRDAAVAQAREVLIAADWAHNAMIQSVILQVEKAYYTYVTAKALLEAEQATYKEAETNLDAARGRHHAGVATVADVLQAKTALAQSKLALDELQGQVQTTRGALATAMGLPASTPYDIGIPRGEIPLNETLSQVDTYLEQAEKQRPDLRAARAQVRAAAANVRKVEGGAYPSISGIADLGRTYYDSSGSWGNMYSGTLQFSVPLFTGYSQHYDELQARADEKAARARLASTRQQVVLEVWTSYYNLKTAEQRVKTSEDLLQSATESYHVALGRYKAGVGSILDLLSAQSALEQARAQRAQANADWFVSLAQLAHDTGTLTAGETTALDQSPIRIEKDGTP
jgi:outer membrane protein